MNKIIFLVLGMSAVTFIPRLIPLVFMKAERLPSKFRQFLSYIPFAVLGALIIPDGLSGIAGRPWISITVLAVAAVVSWIRSSVILAIAVCVTAAWILQVIF